MKILRIFKIIRKLFRRIKIIENPLSNGSMWCFSNNNRCEPKDVFYYKNGEYVKCMNPVLLNYFGHPVDGDGKLINLMYHPYDDENNYEPYYIILKDSQGSIYKTMEAWPPNNM